MTTRNLAARLWNRRSARNLMAVGLTLAVGMPTAVDARPRQEAPPGSTGGGEGTPTLTIDVDVATDDIDDIDTALDDIMDNVVDQHNDLTEARNDLSDANEEWERAENAVNDTQLLIDGLVELSDDVVVGAYVSPPSMADTESLSSENFSDLALRQALLELRADEDADVLGALADAREDLADQQDDEEDAAEDANTARLDAQAELADLEAAAGQQTLFLTAIEDRLERDAGELASLADIDPAAAALLEDDQDELLAALEDILADQELAEALEALAAAEEEREAAEEAAAAAEPAPTPAPEPSSPAPAPSEIGAASGSLSTVSCPSGGSITVDSSLASNLSALLQAASSAGVGLCGGGYRDPSAQISLRQQNCGTSQYAIYEMPSSQCSPPTARPGTSNHERGLAVDFENCSSRGTACYQWLAGNAATYGLYNLPSEPWHWSTDGT